MEGNISGLEGLRKITINPLRVGGVPTGITTENLPNTNIQCFLSINLFGVHHVFCQTNSGALRNQIDANRQWKETEKYFSKGINAGNRKPEN